MFLDTGSQNDRYKMRRKSDCGQLAFQLQQRQQQQPFQQYAIPNQKQPKRNRSLDRSNEKLSTTLGLHRNPGLGGSHMGISRPSAFSGSAQHLNFTLGPLQMYPPYNGECK